MIRIFTCDEFVKTFYRSEVHVPLHLGVKNKFSRSISSQIKNDLSGMLNLQPLVKRPGGIQSINQLIGEISCCGQLS